MAHATNTVVRACWGTVALRMPYIYMASDAQQHALIDVVGLVEATIQVAMHAAATPNSAQSRPQREMTNLS